MRLLLDIVFNVWVKDLFQILLLIAVLLGISRGTFQGLPLSSQWEKFKKKSGSMLFRWGLKEFKHLWNFSKITDKDNKS